MRTDPHASSHGRHSHGTRTAWGHFGELYHANGAANGYDNLGQLTAFARGTLSISSGHTVPDTIAGTPAANESWSLDALGNWTSFTTGTTTQTRTANQQNEITSISGPTTPVYDLNGNMKTDQTGNTLFYDAWNRLVRVMSGPTVLELYTYDALGRRVMENPSGTLPKSLYYSSAWQVLEERWSGATQVQYVWSPVYVDAMIERDRGSERFYVQQDANWNVTAIVNATTGVVQERYVYDPYGQPTILDPTTPSWNTRSASSFAWVYLHQGGRYDTGTGLYTFRNRDYSAALGRWVEVDPMGLLAGDANLYGYVLSCPTSYNDAIGLGPTSGTLTWNDFKKVNDEQGHAAKTSWTRSYKYDYKYTSDLKKQCEQWTATVKARLTSATFSVSFDPENSWVVQGKETDALLRHEALHLRLAEYIAEKAKANLPELEAQGQATNADRDTAEGEAKNKAVDDLKAKVKDYADKWFAMDKAVQTTYDAQTKGSIDVMSQADWEAKWQQLTDSILKSRGWTK